MTKSLIQQLSNYFSDYPTERCYIVFDSAGHPQLPAKFFELAGECDYQQFLPNGADLSSDIQPLIIELPLDMQHPFWQWLFQLPANEGVFWPIASGFDMETVLAHLRSMLQVTLPDGKKVNFRLFDPRVLSRWWPWQQQWQAEALVDLLKPIGCCWLPVVDEWQAILNPQPHNQMSIAPEWLMLSKDQLAQLNKASDKVLFANTRYHLYDYYPQVLAEYHPELIDLLIDQAIKVAQQQGMKSEYAMTQWVIFMFSMGPTFYQDNALTAYFSAYQEHQNDNQLIDNLMAVPADKWQQVYGRYNASGWFATPVSE
ncbi:DUF4123 domain-containing protein [Endozoicomonas sp. SM1973]|uniref:DUF4123 domain-containing protein n=1 Tax=Spartinivicinus marinus TaxID=2994442 RepID=A0A853IFC6_9GAMM|nr:DUF4123 domain-containing protein [Spartinivicinus marinus]MCX4025865.1 DUF4123 domain-containing protein [Spartinivicinus marinus]NYZ68681.1 DUF4123 domain-containing protein [Spartinivicinus marinus]